MQQSNLTAWYIGLSVGAVCVFVSVVLVATILHLARTLAIQSSEIAEALERGRANTASMPSVVRINGSSHQITLLLQELRGHSNRIYRGVL